MNDKDIIQLYLNRDQRALSATAKKYGIYCTSIAKNILGNNEDADECVNDTYLIYRQLYQQFYLRSLGKSQEI